MLKLKQFRKAHKLTQREMAEKLTACGYAIHMNNYNSIENGKRRVNYDFIRAFMKAFPGELDQVIFNLEENEGPRYSDVVREDPVIYSVKPIQEKIPPRRLFIRNKLRPKEVEHAKNNWLAAFRHDQRLTQQEFCNELAKADHHTGTWAIQKIEAGINSPSPDLLWAIKRRFQIDVEALLHYQSKRFKNTEANSKDNKVIKRIRVRSRKFN